MRYNVGKEVLSYEKNGTGRGALQDHVHAAKNSWWQVETGNSLLYRLSRYPTVRRAAEAVGGDYGIVADEAATGAGGGWVPYSPRLS